MGLDDPNLDDDTILDAIVAEPGLLQRPIVERSGRVVIGRPLENVRKLFLSLLNPDLRFLGWPSYRQVTSIAKK